jgi:hypothetical protein
MMVFLSAVQWLNWFVGIPISLRLVPKQVPSLENAVEQVAGCAVPNDTAAHVDSGVVLGVTWASSFEFPLYLKRHGFPSTRTLTTLKLSSNSFAIASRNTAESACGVSESQVTTYGLRFCSGSPGKM